MTQNSTIPHLYRLADGLFFGKIYWVIGDMPIKSRQRNEVKTPPNSGWSHAILIDKGGKFVTLFCPHTLEGFQVSRNSMEVTSMRMDTRYILNSKNNMTYIEDGFIPWSSDRQNRLLKIILDTWMMANKLGLSGKDFDTAAIIINMMGGDVPLQVNKAGAEVNKTSGGKEADILGLLKPVKRNSKRGLVLQFFLPQPRSIREAMAEFGYSRSNVLSHLFILQRDHGIGYVLSNDAATILLPEGCTDPFVKDN